MSAMFSPSSASPHAPETAVLARLGGRARINLFGPVQRTAPVARTVPQAFALDKKRLTAPFSAKRRNAPGTRTGGRFGLEGTGLTFP